MRQTDEEDIRQRLTDLFSGWSPGAGDFHMGRVAAFYHEGDRFLALDTLMPTTSIMDGWQAFKRHWEQAIGAMKRFDCILEDVLRLEVHGDIAWTALVLGVDAELEEGGQPLQAEQQVTLVWQREADGWRIVHEHLSGPVRPET